MHSPHDWAGSTRRGTKGEGNASDGSGTSTQKVLRYQLQRAHVNGTEFERRRIVRREAAVDESSGGKLARRDSNWNWKQLEDYRGFLYFIESASPLSSPEMVPPFFE